MVSSHAMPCFLYVKWYVIDINLVFTRTLKSEKGVATHVASKQILFVKTLNPLIFHFLAQSNRLVTAFKPWFGTFESVTLASALRRWLVDKFKWIVWPRPWLSGYRITCLVVCSYNDFCFQSSSVCRRVGWAEYFVVVGEKKDLIFVGSCSCQPPKKKQVLNTLIGVTAKKCLSASVVYQAEQSKIHFFCETQ